jgi:hypothetical protein
MGLAINRNLDKGWYPLSELANKARLLSNSIRSIIYWLVSKTLSGI